LVLGSPGGSSWVEGGFGLAGWIGMGSVGAGAPVGGAGWTVD